MTSTTLVPYWAVSPMKIWFNKVHESRRSLVETDQDAITIGRDGANKIVLNSPLVSKRQAIVRRENGKLRLENVGINSCMIGDVELIGGESLTFSAGETLRILPYNLTF
jgi:pSer/pThr/pTyr-binding forkhead associated (FHA) protein